MNVITKFLVGASIACLGMSASALTPAAGNNMFFGSKDSDGVKCEAAVKNGTAQFYKPVGKSAERESRLAKTSQRRGEANACFLMETMNGRQWVAMPKHTLVQTDGPTVMYLTECGNTIYDVRWVRDEVKAETPPPTQVTAAAPASWNIPKAGFIEIPSWVPKTLENGKIYIAPNGDTYQDVRFTRLCINLMKGEIIDWRGTFASSPEEALRQCLAWQAGETYKHTLPDTSNQSQPAAPAPQSAAPQAPIAQAPQATAPQQPDPQAAAPQPQGSKGSHTCNAKLANGQFVDATGVDLSDCHKNLHAKVLSIDPNARQQGDIVRGHRPQS